MTDFDIPEGFGIPLADLTTGLLPVKTMDALDLRYAGGGDGEDGREVQLRATATDIEWRYVGEPAWTLLIPLSEITGADGESPSLRVDSGFIQWQLPSEGATWHNLIATADLEGADGASAYEVAVAEGFVGNEAAWLASLVGADGTDATLTTYADMTAVDALTATGIGTVTVADIGTTFSVSTAVGDAGTVLISTTRTTSTSGNTDGIVQETYVLDATTQIAYRRIRTRIASPVGSGWQAWTSWFDSAPFASEADFGITRYASAAEAQAMTSFTRTITPQRLASAAATSPTNSRIARYSSAGRLQSNAPSVDADVATKLYADTGGWASAPATATSAGVAGSKAFDGSFLYICTATNTWRRVGIAAW